MAFQRLGAIMDGTDIVPAIIALYFAPFLIALIRRHRNAAPIFVVNIVFGWTFLGWVIALIWSLTSNTREIAKKRRAIGGLRGAFLALDNWMLKKVGPVFDKKTIGKAGEDAVARAILPPPDLAPPQPLPGESAEDYLKRTGRG